LQLFWIRLLRRQMLLGQHNIVMFLTHVSECLHFRQRQVPNIVWVRSEPLRPACNIYGFFLEYRVTKSANIIMFCAPCLKPVEAIVQAQNNKAALCPSCIDSSFSVPMLHLCAQPGKLQEAIGVVDDFLMVACSLTLVTINPSHSSPP
jgi:hypothetical protein